MTLVRSGVSRLVLLLGDWAIKLPHPGSWRRFLWGLQANMQERDWCGVDRVAPLHYSNRYGLINIMARADSVPFRDEYCFRWFARMIYSDHDCRDYMLHDPKSENYGWLNGRLVKIDYA